MMPRQQPGAAVTVSHSSQEHSEEPWHPVITTHTHARTHTGHRDETRCSADAAASLIQVGTDLMSVPSPSCCLYLYISLSFPPRVCLFSSSSVLASKSHDFQPTQTPEPKRRQTTRSCRGVGRAIKQTNNLGRRRH